MTDTEGEQNVTDISVRDRTSVGALVLGYLFETLSKSRNNNFKQSYEQSFAAKISSSISLR